MGERQSVKLKGKVKGLGFATVTFDEDGEFKIKDVPCSTVFFQQPVHVGMSVLYLEGHYPLGAEVTVTVEIRVK